MWYVPSHCPRRVTAPVHLQPIYRLSMFDSPQLGTGAPAAITTMAVGEVEVVSFAAACSFFDHSMLPRAVVMLPRVAERRHGAARRRSRRLLPRHSAAAIIARLGRATRALPAAQAALLCASTARILHSWPAEKNVHL